MNKQVITISILTYNRKDILKELLENLLNKNIKNSEIIVVDNNSNDGTDSMIKSMFPSIKLISTKRNIGAAARNLGIMNAKGEFVITIDDDLIGLTEKHISDIGKTFSQNRRIYAVCFKVIDFYSQKISNWCHPYQKEKYGDKKFLTTEITEGAVAFNKTKIIEIGGYPEEFFLSNEGADLACRIINDGGDILFLPKIVLKHKHSDQSRKNWRRYYYDTRNHLWLALRNYRFWFGTKYVISKVLIMMFYSLRDGFLKYWLKGLIDSIKGIPKVMKNRKVIAKSTELRIKKILRNRPGILYRVKLRIKNRSVRI